jgi:hypothetical protein
MQRKLLGLLFAAASYGFYKYSRMTPEQREDLKKRGSDFLNKNFKGMRNSFDKKPATMSTENNY